MINWRQTIISGIVITLAALILLAIAASRKAQGFPKFKKMSFEEKIIPSINSDDKEIDYGQIISLNAFHPERGQKIEKEKTVSPISPKRRQVPVKFELKGIFGYGDTAGAIIVSGDIGKQRIFKVGEALGSGYQLKELENGKAIVVRGTETIELLLNNPLPKKEKPGAKTP